MKIVSFRLFRTTLRCKKPFHIASGVSDVCHGILLELTTDDETIGWGEAAPDPYLTGETFTGCLAALKEQYLPAVLGLNPFAIGEAHARMGRVLIGHPAARCAVDLALHDLMGQRSGQSVVALLGGTGRPVATNYSIGLGTAEEAASEARSLVEQGYATIKLKVGADPGEDVERAEAVRSVIGPDLGLRIDANEGWNAHQARYALSRMERLEVELCEQPLERHELAATARLRAQTRIPLAADESVHTMHDALHAIQAGAYDIFNLKLMKSGGLWPARQIVTLARSHGVQLMVGGMVGESSLAVTAAASLASAFGFEYADLDADLLLADKLGGALKLENGSRWLSEAPGWGFGELNLRLIEAL
jgi:L-alanine-DL-glutamate epimerase-like enolase superfamily enzyme